MNFSAGAGLTRRRLLTIAAGGAAATATFSVFGPPPAAAADEFDVLRQRYFDLLAGVPDYDPDDPDLRKAIDAKDEATAALLTTVDTRADRPGVFRGEELRGATTSRPMQTTALNLAVLAKSWATLGSRYHHDEELAAVTVAGLQTLHDLLYHVGQPRFDNWYHWQIGTPRGANETCTILYGHVPEQLRSDLAAAVAWFVPDPGFNNPPSGEQPTDGSNRLDMSLNVAAAGILARQADRVELASRTVPGAFPYVTSGSGFYRDGSYIYHDNVPYAGTYGRALVSAACVCLPILAGSSWEVPADSVQPLYDGVERCFRPWLVDGQSMPPVMGRAVSRYNQNSYWLMGSLLMLAEGAPVGYRDHWRSLVRGWLERDDHDDFMIRREIVEVLLAKLLLASDVPPLAAKDGPCVFPEMDRLTHRGSGWTVGLATASRRTRRYEAMSGENRRAWHHGAGTRYLFLASEQRQFANDWFPTVDPYRMPGTTVDSQRLPDTLGGAEPSAGHYDFTGGTSVGGRYTADGFYDGARFASWAHHERTFGSTTDCRMSWFAVPHGLVCLGSGIAGGSGAPVETVLENRMVLQAPTGTWYVDGHPVAGSDQLGWSEAVDDVGVLTLPGVASYVMLDGPRTVHLRHEQRSGAWIDINTLQGSPTVHTREFQTAWIDHGATPGDASFSYLLAPLASPADGRRLARDPGVRVVENSSRVQAVAAPGTGFCGVTFHEAGEVRFGDMTVGAERHTSVSVLLSSDRRSVEIATSDPSQLRTGFEVDLELPAGGHWRLGAQDETVTASLSGRRLRLSLDAGPSDGRPHRLLLRR